MRSKRRVDLFVIDGQNDFCASGNEPNDYPLPAGGKRPGALFVSGADKEGFAVAEMINALEDANEPSKHLISKIHSTLDCHQVNDCAHNTAWRDREGKTPPPFTIVMHDDVKAQKYIPAFSMGVWEGRPISALDWALKYTKALYDLGRNPLCLWPEHCLIQSWGCSIYYPLQLAYNRWAKTTGRWPDYITKGQWPWTEHYSAMKADVPDPTRPETQMNAGVVNDAFGADLIVWCGWAGSHCLKWTALDAIDYFEPTDDEKKQGKKNEFIAKSVFLEDASAAVPNPPGPGAPDFCQWRVDFLKNVKDRGARVMTIAELVKELKA
jgi:nicotinamidase/pyrazinamidase